jgi:hypothetical protein
MFSNDATKLHSNPKATTALFLDFDGHIGPAYGIGPVVTTPAFEVPAAIPEIHAGVAAYFAPFDLDVTTEEPAGGRVAIVRIGGKWSDWFPQRNGGTSLPGGLDAGRNVAYVFAVDSLGNNTRHVLRSIVHEAGHVFGLLHQEQFGDAAFAPIMGGGNLEAARVGWVVGNNERGAPQDDVAILTDTLGLAQAVPPSPSVPPPAAPAVFGVTLAIVGDPTNGRPYNIIATVPPGTESLGWKFNGNYAGVTRGGIWDYGHGYDGRQKPLITFGLGKHTMECGASDKDGKPLATGSITWVESAPPPPTSQDSAEVALGGVTYTITRKGK